MWNYWKWSWVSLWSVCVRACDCGFFFFWGILLWRPCFSTTKITAKKNSPKKNWSKRCWIKSVCIKGSHRNICRKRRLTVKILRLCARRCLCRNDRVRLVVDNLATNDINIALCYTSAHKHLHMSETTKPVAMWPTTVCVRVRVYICVCWHASSEHMSVVQMNGRLVPGEWEKEKSATTNCHFQCAFNEHMCLTCLTKKEYGFSCSTQQSLLPMHTNCTQSIYVRFRPKFNHAILLCWA